MKRAPLLAALFLTVLGVGPLKADLLVGPSTFDIVGGSDTSWGIQFTALDNSTLTGFDYSHNPTQFGNPFSGTISLNDLTTSTNVYSSSYSPNSPAVIALTGLNVALVNGDKYQLVATSNMVSGGNDEVYTYTAPFPASNSDISVTNGVFNNNPGFQEAFGWAAFTNIATTGDVTVTAVVPELPSSALFVPGIALVLGVTFVTRRRRPLAA